jgi:hypothetical protein
VIHDIRLWSAKHAKWPKYLESITIQPVNKITDHKPAKWPKYYDLQIRGKSVTSRTVNSDNSGLKFFWLWGQKEHHPLWAGDKL